MIKSAAEIYFPTNEYLTKKQSFEGKCEILRTISQLNNYEASVNNTCSSSEDGGEAHVNFAASSHTHLVQPTKLPVY